MLISKLNTCFCPCFPAVLNCYKYILFSFEKKAFLQKF